MKHVVATAAAVVAGLAFASAAQAASGLTVTMKVTGKSEPQTMQIQLDPQHMRAEGIDQKGEKQLFIFDGARQVMDVVNLQAKTYSELTKADVDRIAGQMSDAMAQMQQRLATLPPEQRAQVEAMMKGRMGGAGGPAAKPDFRRTGTDTVGKWTCTKDDRYQNDRKVGEVCTVDPKDLGFSASDFQVTREMADFFGRMVPGGGAQMFAIGSAEAQGYSGVPVRTRIMSGNEETTMELTSVTRGSIPDSAFTVPAGLQKRDMLGGRGR